MLNLLIIDKNIYHSRRLLNYISKNSYQVRVHSIATTLTEGIQMLNTGLIDITLISLNDDINSIISELHTIPNCYSDKYRKSILIISNNINSTPSDSYIYEYIPYTENTSLLFYKISELAKNKLAQLNNTTLLSQINKELEYIGYNLAHIGTKYLSESIALIYNNYDGSENLNKNIYPVIANRYHKTVNNVKCNITSATNFMFYECDENRLKNYFNFYTVSRPKPKLVIYTVLNKLYKAI